MTNRAKPALSIPESGVPVVCDAAGWFFSGEFGFGVPDGAGAMLGSVKFTTWIIPVAFGSVE
jgi:hypothetical protein